MEPLSAQSNQLSKRRRFQAPITSYFATSPTSASCSQSETFSHYNYAARTNTPNPVLPNKVQSSLLTVGMRVRKAVPEGYQTKLKVSKLNAYPSSHGSTHAASSTNIYAELQPYCGGFKVGNLAVQSFPSCTWEEHEGGPTRLDEESIPIGSQESLESMDLTPLNPNKRLYEQEEDASQELENAAPCYPQASLPFTLSNYISPRTILQPKLRQRTKKSTANWNETKHTPANSKPDLVWELSERENYSPIVDLHATDFGEASFLRRREEVDEDFKMSDI
ncbi:hypothetical protein LOZ12_000574 [Ophidiomyces ophidiicola]|uniref:Uncharacterized protein n=1 Tax=Ophidiomyces ophidiicola TaxID=1387563 RepID=A0ACB8V543_9EURO|nr:hypothetical protein LOZ64_000316 [Ophidiomyces ophidiicola]KAI1955747.1 hypothetical protein LOZ62_000299 [Ophidiomyces ophidiicola]KAI1976043.1 hypothetical protein LOZ56_000361 [Ophidiomyces ophidiicola]KAI2011310.1 hypothetical protein LOZ50_000669 [Ophidiomyces ophidiicola]KAI2022667.1 hypothetical protein LOZ46_001808 [Ophidiomyces ophidiicola]